MNDNNKTVVESEILFTLETKVNGKDYFYQIEHDHYRYIDGRYSDSLTLSKQSKDRGVNSTFEVINSDFFHDLKQEDHKLFKDKVREYASEAYDRQAVDMEPIYQANREKLYSLKFK
ncbi:hypothetical protein [Klebsiella pneumoniae]|uniref:hypothetical protein n=1 Tax=Klebsiella pneumoniae TaxID=573 RepID=UPI002962335C|nr:hypothetical protein [Klebsiella pneumoniae]MDW1257590.1 hypothetical protein [Klebsiella pneumoniae]